MVSEETIRAAAIVKKLMDDAIPGDATFDSLLTGMNPIGKEITNLERNEHLASQAIVNLICALNTYVFLFLHPERRENFFPNYLADAMGEDGVHPEYAHLILRGK